MATTVYTLDVDEGLSVRRDNDNAWTIELSGDDELHLTTEQMRIVVDGFLLEQLGGLADEPMTPEEIDEALRA